MFQLLLVGRALGLARRLVTWLGWGCALLLGCGDYDTDLLSAASVGESRCGDGALGPGELCDTAIATGNPGACPSACPPADEACAPRILVGADCQVQCVIVELEALAKDAGFACQGDDGAHDAGDPPGGEDPAVRSMAPSSLVHRYSFDGDGTTIHDSVGEADGHAVDCALDTEGHLSLRRTRGSYVELPAGLLSSQRSATLELWVTWSGLRTSRFERIFDFGNRRGRRGDDDAVETTFFLSPYFDQPFGMRVYFRDTDSDETRVMPDGRFPAGRPVHVAVVLDAEREMISLYLDGRRIDSERWRSSLAGLRDENAWLGKSQYADDPHLDAVFDEFRIYRTALSADALARSFELGPDRLLELE